jgi:cytochrome c553
MTTRNRRLLWATSVIIACVLGYLLGRRSQACPTSSLGDGSVAGKGPGSPPGGPSRISVNGKTEGDVKSGGTSDASGATKSGGGGNDAAGGGGDDAGGGNTRGSGAAFGSGKSPTDSDAKGSLGTDVAHGLASATSGLGGSTANDRVGPTIDTVTSPTFAYDLTGLPRYANVTREMSGLSTRKDMPADTSTVVAMLSADSFDRVSSWYHEHAPPGWHETKMSNMEQMAAQLSPQNIAKMLSGYAKGTAASDSSTAPPQAVPGHSVAIWTAPDNDAHHYRGIMVVTTPDQPTRIVMKRSVSQ